MTICLLISQTIGQSPEKIQVLDVTVEGNIRISDEDILRNARLWPGKEIDIEDIQKSVKNLWKLGRFGDIQIYIEEESIEGIILLIEVEEIPILDKIEFTGNKKISDNTLKEKIELQPGQILSEHVIFNSIQSIKKAYKEDHYHNVEIDTSFSTGNLGYSKNLKFKITEGKKVKIHDIQISGNSAIKDKKILKQLKETKPRKWYMPWRGGYNKDKFEEDKNSLISFYQRNGYNDFYITNSEVTFTDNGNGIIISIELYEGPQYHIRNIVWEGNFVHSDQRLNNRLGMESGDIFNKEDFEIALANEVNPLYRDDGYFYSQIEPTIIPVGIDSLDIQFNIVENEIVYIRKIVIGGNEKTHENVVRRRLHFYPGDTFNQNKLIDGLRDIMMLNYFQNVIPNVKPVDETQIDILIDLEEKQTGQAQFSMGYNGFYGLTGGGAFEFPNFRGRGQNLSISYQRGVNASTSFNQPTFSSSTANTGASFQSMSLSFIDPGVLDTRNLIGVSVFYSERGRGQGTYLPFDIYQISGSARWGRQFKWPDRFFHGTWVVSTSSSRYFSSAISDLTNYFGSSIESSITISDDGVPYFSTSGRSITQIISRDSRNHPEYPSFGSNFTWKSTLSGSFLGGEEDYHKHEFDFNWFSPIIGKLVLRQNAKTGVIKSIPVSEGERSIIPPGTRFFLGGSGIPYGEMLRGYQDNTIGPFGITRPRGGNIIIKYSLELRYQFSEAPTVYGLLFTELGNNWSGFDIVDPFDLKRSAGVGIRTFMPMLGMLGFDMGYGFDDTTYDGDKLPQGWNYHIIFGLPF